MKTKTYWVKLASRASWDAHFAGCDAESAARKFIARARIPVEGRVDVVEAAVFAKPEKASFLASDLAMTPEEAVRYLHDEQKDDARGGIAAVVVTALLLMLVLFVPSREGASPSSKLSLAAIALFWMAWGIRQIHLVRSRRSKEPNK